MIINKHGFIAVNKPAGMPSQSDLTGDKSIQSLSEIYCHTRLHLLNRLDRPASGLVILSKKDSFTKHYIALQKKEGIIKNYIAITSKVDVPPTGTFVNFLSHDTKSRKARINLTGEEKDKVTMDYEILHELDNYYVVKCVIHSGKFHQIRVQLANQGMHIKGDVKYGARRKNRDRSIHLHAYEYQLTDPVNKKPIHLTAPLPNNDGIWKVVTELL